jgi:hypothetical protein
VEERIALMRDDPAVELTVDGNAIGGILASIFAVDVTGSPGQCATCHTVSVMGSMRAYVRGPGIVLRCPACAEVVVRIVETPSGTLIDVSGVQMLRVPGSREA